MPVVCIPLIRFTLLLSFVGNLSFSLSFPKQTNNVCSNILVFSHRKQPHFPPIQKKQTKKKRENLYKDRLCYQTNKKCWYDIYRCNNCHIYTQPPKRNNKRSICINKKTIKTLAKANADLRVLFILYLFEPAQRPVCPDSILNYSPTTTTNKKNVQFTKKRWLYFTKILPKKMRTHIYSRPKFLLTHYFLLCFTLFWFVRA